MEHVDKKRLIVHVTSEVAPFYKRGGLGDVAGALPVYLENERYHNIVITLYYQGQMKGLENCIAGDQEFSLSYLGVNYPFTVYSITANKVEYYFIQLADSWELEKLENRDMNQTYSEPSGIVPYFYFAKAALRFLLGYPSHPSYILCHDWQSGGLFGFPGLTAEIRKRGWNKTIFLIHNYNYQGEIYEDIYPYLEPETAAEIQQVFNECGTASLLALGLKNSDYSATVSYSYAEELTGLKAPHTGLKYLDLCQRRVLAFMNGIDPGIWHPGNSPYLPVSFGSGSLENKKRIKQEILKKYGFLPADRPRPPLVLMLCRLTFQKGVNLFIDFVRDRKEMVENMAAFLGTGIYFVVLGTPGDGIKGNIDEGFCYLQEEFPGRFLYLNHYTEELAHSFLAAADILIAPSLFEPCGLVQVYAMAFGAIPVVRAVGGMKDTVCCHFRGPFKSTGFHIDQFSQEALLRTMRKVSHIYYHSPQEWQKIIQRGMAADFSWNRMKKQYQVFFQHLEEEQEICFSRLYQAVKGSWKTAP
jgi:starch synthase